MCSVSVIRQIPLNFDWLIFSRWLKLDQLNGRDRDRKKERKDRKIDARNFNRREESRLVRVCVWVCVCMCVCEWERERDSSRKTLVSGHLVSQNFNGIGMVPFHFWWIILLSIWMNQIELNGHVSKNHCLEPNHCKASPIKRHANGYRLNKDFTLHEKRFWHFWPRWRARKWSKLIDPVFLKHGPTLASFRQFFFFIIAEDFVIRRIQTLIVGIDVKESDHGGGIAL